MGSVATATQPIINVQVRELVELRLRTGYLLGWRDFVGRDRAFDRIRGHQRLHRARGPTYEKEVRVSHEVVHDDFSLTIQGRIAGFLRDATGVLVEEFKTR